MTYPKYLCKTVVISLILFLYIKTTTNLIFVTSFSLYSAAKKNILGFCLWSVKIQLKVAEKTTLHRNISCTAAKTVTGLNKVAIKLVFVLFFTYLHFSRKAILVVFALCGLEAWVLKCILGLTAELNHFFSFFLKNCLDTRYLGKFTDKKKIN